MYTAVGLNLNDSKAKLEQGLEGTQIMLQEFNSFLFQRAMLWKSPIDLTVTIACTRPLQWKKVKG